jgi:hypothetical protein
VVIFVNGAPFWYPVYTLYPYGYNAPPDTSTGPDTYPADDGYVPAINSSGDDSGPTQADLQYSDLGASWGQDLRRDIATWDQFIGYLKVYIVTAPAWAQADFREAFIDAYGLNGAAAYDKATTEAAGVPNAPGPLGPKIITYPPPPPPPSQTTVPAASPAALPPPPPLAAPMPPPPAPETVAPWYARLWNWL